TGVGVSVERYLCANETKCPTFLWIPTVSPSAAKRGTRVNARGIDVNRHFREDATDPEVRAVMAIMRRYRFDLHLSFHEDGDRTREFYLYDTDDAPHDAALAQLFAEMEHIGIAPYSGEDDAKSALKVRIRNGYFSERWDGGGFTRRALAGQSTIYAVRSGIAKRGITLEIPGKAPQDVKDKLVAIIFQHFFANAKRDE
ncbi:MAG: hypothetical protein HYZ07_01355, partial [Candidatus Harrisonbacteria bacterium]|nr:hypothetical protein [Candidatus Harrisonbacteria bacterium]